MLFDNLTLAIFLKDQEKRLEVYEACKALYSQVKVTKIQFSLLEKIEAFIDDIEILPTTDPKQIQNLIALYKELKISVTRNAKGEIREGDIPLLIYRDLTGASPDNDNSLS